MLKKDIIINLKVEKLYYRKILSEKERLKQEIKQINEFLESHSEIV